ncbi:hypothetical protein M5D96_001471 [Drosophila gunungcola]|uniref:Uncharacterized protein n=1 Tax=Drosophila gunungcola TaxID=103775 RepID=A0A9Q0BV27_9MUSC|nr:hypothetical protein M5D96_001471 [Drosophila gunungcola]
MTVASRVGILDQRVAKTEGGRCEGVGHRGIHLGTVPLVVAGGHQFQVEELGHLAAQDDGQELAEGDVLEHGAHNASRLLVDLLIAPMGIQLTQLQRNPVVFAHPNVVHGQQSRLLSASPISRPDALGRNGTPLAHVLGGIPTPVDEQPVPEHPGIVRGLGAVRVNGRGVDERGHLVGLFPPGQHTVASLGRSRSEEFQTAHLERRQPRIVQGHFDGKAGGMEVLAAAATGYGTIDGAKGI